jgi:hypothetical protein
MISIAASEPGSDIGDGQTVFIEHVVSEFLQASYIAFVAGESDLERADKTELQRRWRLPRFAKSLCAEMSG